MSRQPVPGLSTTSEPTGSTGTALVPQPGGGVQTTGGGQGGDNLLENFGGGRPGTPEGVTDAVAAVWQLANRMPNPQNVKEVDEDDDTPLSKRELRLKTQTEEIIESAQQAGDAAVWVTAYGLELAKKGRWHRDTHRYFEDYVFDLTGRSASYFRRLRQCVPLAFAVYEKHGVILVPGQARDLLKTAQTHSLQTAVSMFGVLRAEAEKAERELTASIISKAHAALPPALPDDEAEAQTLLVSSARRAVSVPIGTQRDGEDSDGAKGQEGSSEKDGQDGAATEPTVRFSLTLPESLAQALEGWAEDLTEHLHKVKVDRRDVIEHTLALALAQGQESLNFIAGRIQSEHAVHAEPWLVRFEWKAGGVSRVVERRDKGHRPPRRGEPAPSCAGKDGEGKDAPACTNLAIWKVERTRKKTTTAYYCQSHLPEKDTPTGAWRD
ncbi:hypothetical protein ABZ569_32380 [Streptomyces albus]|uniref:hypothetical protein n=1 Tax=Streptomyces albus TaxID=1888 RepID=UPI0033C158EC